MPLVARGPAASVAAGGGARGDFGSLQREPTATGMALRSKGPLVYAAAAAAELGLPPPLRVENGASSPSGRGRTDRTRTRTPPPLSTSVASAPAPLPSSSSSSPQPGAASPLLPPTGAVTPRTDVNHQNVNNRKHKCPSPPPIVKDKRSDATYARKGLLGEGGFARCYEITDIWDNRFAAKVVPKATLKLQRNKNKLFAEIKIHQSMRHDNIVKFHHCFEDNMNVYMVLELCERKTLMEMLKQRRRLSEPEVRYYMSQILDACRYMHANRIIHRDLKLGNLFLTANMEVKIGDFGLAAIIRHDGERKKTICGTPNYIAPEILFDTQNGHSYEVDVWSLGVIMYTLFIGRPPFQTKDVKAIYRRIKENQYEFPPQIAVSPSAKSLIQALLSTRPEVRPSVANIMEHPFFRSGFTPSQIPASALHTKPDFPESGEFKLAASRADDLRSSQLTTTEIHQTPPSVNEELASAAHGAAHREARLKTASSPPRQQSTAAMEPNKGTTDPGNTIPRIATSSSALGSRHHPMATSTSGRPFSANGSNGVAKNPQGVVVNGDEIATTSEDEEARRGDGPMNPGSELFRSNFAASTASAVGAPLLSKMRNVTSNGEGYHKVAVAVPSSASASSSRTTASSKTREPLASSSRVTPARSSMLPLLTTPPPPTPTPPLPPPSPSSASLPYSGLVGVLEAMLRNLTVGFADRKSGKILGVLDSELRHFGCSAGGSSREDLTKRHAPRIFISKWIDYSNKYGLGYQLTDGSVGVYFNDSTSIILSPDDRHFEYLYYARSADGTVMHRQRHTLPDYPADIGKKVVLLKHFRGYMTENLFKASTYTFTDKTKTANLDFLTKYLRTKHAVIFRLSNRVVQINFFDHTKLVLSHDARLVTYIDKNRDVTTGLLAEMLARGTTEQLSRVRYAKDVLEQLIAKRDKKRRSAAAAEPSSSAVAVTAGGMATAASVSNLANSERRARAAADTDDGATGSYGSQRRQDGVSTNGKVDGGGKKNVNEHRNVSAGSELRDRLTECRVTE